MPGPFSSILRAINRPIGRPLNILCADTHEAYQTNLAKTGHNFFALSHPQWNKWDCKLRPYPYNYQPLYGQQPSEQIKIDMVFDLVLSQNKFGQFQILSQLAKNLGCPLISLEHTLPVPTWPPKTRMSYRQMSGDVDVFIAQYSIPQWGFDSQDANVRVIRHGIDTDFFDGWTGGDGKILTVANEYPNRNWCLGFDLYRQLTKGLPVNPWGRSPGFSKAADSTEHLRSIYQRASIFLNTSLVSPVPTALLEAMAVGCTVVSTATCMIPEIIEDGVNGYMSNDPEVLRRRLEELLSDPAKAATIGAAARKTIIDKFSLDRFVRDWNQLFESTVGKARGSRK